MQTYRRFVFRSASAVRRFSAVDTKVQMTSAGLVPITSKLDIVDCGANAKWPMYQIMDQNGKLSKDAPEISVDQESAVHMYRMMARIQALDDIFYNAQVNKIAVYRINFIYLVQIETRSHFFLYAECRRRSHSRGKCLGS